MKFPAIILVSLALSAAALAQNEKPAAPSAAPTPVTAPGGKPQPQAKTQEEFKAYQEANAKSDAPSLETAADEFAQKFPASQLRTLLYNRTQQMYRDAGNNEKVIEAGRKSLAIDPTDPVPNVLTAYALVQGTRDGDPDREAKLNEGQADAQRALDNLDTGMMISPAAPPQAIQAAKNTIQLMAYETLGGAAMQRKDWAGAEKLFDKGANLDKEHPDGVLLLRTAVAQDNQGKYAEALETVNKSIQYTEPNSQEQEMAKQERARLQKLLGTIPEVSPVVPAEQPK